MEQVWGGRVPVPLPSRALPVISPLSLSLPFLTTEPHTLALAPSLAACCTARREPLPRRGLLGGAEDVPEPRGPTPAPSDGRGRVGELLAGRKAVAARRRRAHPAHVVQRERHLCAREVAARLHRAEDNRAQDLAAGGVPDAVGAPQSRVCARRARVEATVRLRAENPASALEHCRINRQ